METDLLKKNPQVRDENDSVLVAALAFLVPPSVVEDTKALCEKPQNIKQYYLGKQPNLVSDVTKKDQHSASLV